MRRVRTRRGPTTTRTKTRTHLAKRVGRVGTGADPVAVPGGPLHGRRQHEGSEAEPASSKMVFGVLRLVSGRGAGYTGWDTAGFKLRFRRETFN